ncbi:DUF6680 family protein [Burkholderia gladioli]
MRGSYVSAWRNGICDAGATLLGPVLAVQAQKWVERAREATNRKQSVFTTLMATRQSRVSIDHVRALNSIDLAFYGRRVLGVPLRGTEGPSGPRRLARLPRASLCPTRTMSED